MVVSEPKANLGGTEEVKFFEWLKHQKKIGRVIDYWAFSDKPGLLAILKVNFESELSEVLETWDARAPAVLKSEQLLSRAALEAELAKRILG